MNYIPPYSQLRDKLSVNSKTGELIATVKLGDIENFIGLMLLAIPVDEDWYRRTYPDIDEAIRQGLIGSGREHFVRNGYLEGRHPFAMAIDEDWYLSAYQDIASAVSAGAFASAKDHFTSYGYEEGRMPGRPF